MPFDKLKSVFQTKQNIEIGEELAPSFKTLMRMKHDLPYLKDFSYKKISNEAGDSKSAFKGRGIEFEEIRSYQFGDDIRDIDWRVTARKNQPYTKLYTEEKDRRIYIWLDLSSKMYFGTQNELKSVTASKTAALLGWLALSYKDKIGFALYNGNKTYIFEPMRQENYFLAVLKKIEEIAKENLETKTQTEPFDHSIHLLKSKINRQSVVFLIGSFDLDDEAFKKEATHLMQTNEVYLIDISDPLENTPPPEGEYMAEYLSKKVLIQNTGKSYEESYLAYFRNKHRALGDLCKKYGNHYRLIKTNLPIYKQLRPI